MADQSISDAETQSDSTPSHHIGCADLPPGMSRSKYFEKLSLLEISAFYDKNPGRKAVRTWREKSPEQARYSVIAPSALSNGSGGKSFPTSDSAQESVATLAESCALLKAEALVFRTPANFTPSSSNRARMKTFFNEIATQERFGDTALVWDPDGLWEPAGISDIVESTGILVALDPLAQDPLDENGQFVAEQMARGIAYLRISGLGHSRRRYESYELEMIAEMLVHLEKSWVLFAHTGKYPDALAMVRELATFADLEA